MRKIEIFHQKTKVDSSKMLKNKSLIIELWGFMKQYKAWWLAPIIIILILLSIFIISLQSSQVTPFIYALF